MFNSTPLFAANDHVRIIKFPAYDPLNGATGTVVGKTNHAYIVWLDDASLLREGWICTPITEHCLKKI